MRSFLHYIRGALQPAGADAEDHSDSDALSEEVRNVIGAAKVILREPDDDGPRVAVMGLRGAFIYSREEADRRVRLAFPELSEGGVRRAVRYLESRVRLRTQPVITSRRGGWVHGWRDNADQEFYR